MLKDVLVSCGMRDCHHEFGLIHGGIDGAGVRLYYQIEDYKDAGKYVAQMLADYKERADKEGFKHYGLKVNHTLQAPGWKVMGPIFKAEWPDARYIISIRHPLEIVKSIERLKIEPVEDDIMRSWMSTISATDELLAKRDARVVVYPDCFVAGRIKKVVRELGMTWPKAADSVFKASKINTESLDDRKRFGDSHPAEVAAFERIASYAK